MKIAIVEDEPKLAKLLQDYLNKEGYTALIHNNGREALASITAQPPDLVLLDWMLPELDGMSICREIRKFSNLPIIMLTARIEEIDRLLGLELGADDYICKPFSPREVVARVKAVLRRTNAYDSAAGEVQLDKLTDGPSNFTMLGSLKLDPDSATISIADKSCALTAVELRLLSALSQRPGQIFNRAQLMRQMYEDNRIVSDRTIDSHVKKLRQKIESLDMSTEYIHSVYGIGYKYEL